MPERPHPPRDIRLAGQELDFLDPDLHDLSMLQSQQHPRPRRRFVWPKREPEIGIVTTADPELPRPLDRMQASHSEMARRSS